jgi:predicted transcriptional regulator of viral defense system
VDRNGPGVALLAERQRGLITREQLLALGFSDRAIARAVAAGRLHRVHRGVYLVGHAVMLPFATEHAART